MILCIMLISSYRKHCSRLTWFVCVQRSLHLFFGIRYKKKKNVLYAEYPLFVLCVIDKLACMIGPKLFSTQHIRFTCECPSWFNELVTYDFDKLLYYSFDIVLEIGSLWTCSTLGFPRTIMISLMETLLLVLREMLCVLVGCLVSPFSVQGNDWCISLRG